MCMYCNMFHSLSVCVCVCVCVRLCVVCAREGDRKKAKSIYLWDGVGLPESCLPAECLLASTYSIAQRTGRESLGEDTRRQPPCCLQFDSWTHCFSSVSHERLSLLTSHDHSLRCRQVTCDFQSWVGRWHEIVWTHHALPFALTARWNMTQKGNCRLICGSAVKGLVFKRLVSLLNVFIGP